MDKQKLILVACGTGIATSTVVCKKVEDLIASHGINARIIQCMISEVGAYEDQADLLVTTTISSRNYKFPVVNAINYLTNINPGKIDLAVIEALK